MATNVFGAIYIGSYEVSLKIFEFSQKKKMKEIDYIRARIDLGKDAYRKSILGYELVEELCEILSEFKQIMNSYKVNTYEVYASAVFREIDNELFVLNQISLRTGMEVNVISNSEVRFISYKSVAGREAFERIIQKSAVIIDVGGANLQITYFKNGELYKTEHIETGPMKIRDLLYDNGNTEETYKKRIEEYLYKKFDVFKALYLNDSVEYVAFLNDYGMDLVNRLNKDANSDNTIKSKKLFKYIDELQKMSLLKLTAKLDLSNDKDPLIIPTLMLYKSIVNIFNPNEVWIPGVNINDGIAFDYAQKNKLIKVSHDFDADVVSAARRLSEHYSGYSMHIDALTSLSQKIYNATKKLHGLGKREELLLEVATLLHDCGKYISLSSASKCAYHIIMSSEIIGLTHAERQIVALTVLYNALPLDDFEELSDKINREQYLVIAKLSAILRVVNALDQSHRQKFKNIHISMKERELIFTVETIDDISLEQALFDDKTRYFENVFSVKPVLRVKRVF